MKSVVFIIFTLCVFLLVPASAEHDEEFFEKVYASDVIGDDETIVLSSNVYFYPNKKGHGLFSGGGNKKEKGHILFTDSGYYVISWSRRNKAYEVLHSESYSELSSADVTGNSPMVRLVTETKLSGNFNSYEIMDSRNALAPNVPKTKEARKLINAGIEGLDVKQIASAKDVTVAQAAVQQERMLELEERIKRLENAGSGSQIQAKDSECDCKCEQ